MAWHVHYKDGKYAIWSSITDEYITPWTTQKEIYLMYRESAIRTSIESAKENIENAEKDGCSAEFYFRCDSPYLGI